MSWNRSVTNEEWEIIDRYLDGTMEGEELQQFVLKLEQDESWREKTESCRLIRAGIAEAALAEKMKTWPATQSRSDNDTNTHVPVRKMLRWVAAACVVLAIASGIVWWLNQPGENEKIYSKYYQPDPGLLTVMGPAESYQFDQAMVDYKSGEYKKAAEGWEALRGVYTSDTLHYFIASAWQANGEWEKAEQNYSVVVSDINSALYSDACWYLGLIHLRNGKEEEARTWIGNSSHALKDELLNAIKK